MASIKQFSKADLVSRVLELDTFETKKSASEVVELIIHTIVNEVAEGTQVNVSGLGSFKPATQGARKGTMNGKAWTSPAKSTVKFSASANFKKALA